MRGRLLFAAFLLLNVAAACAGDVSVFQQRRGRAATALSTGVLLLHASSELGLAADGFRQDPFFYYFTGLENTSGAVLAIDGKTRESWLFLPTHPPFERAGLQPEVRPGAEATKRLAIEHVVDWADLEAFLASRVADRPVLYYADDRSKYEELPPALSSAKSPAAPAWLQVIVQRWPTFEAKDASDQVNAIMEVQSADEIAALRSAAKATVAAIMAGMRAIRPGVSQRSVELTVVSACWKAGAHGVSFWPWAMAGENAVFPKPFTSLARYDHLDRNMAAGELVRLDVGCEWDRYSGDLGRTIPVSGRYDEAQRETWDIFVAAYRVGARTLREGASVDDVFAAWQKELVSHRATAKSELAKHALDSWAERKNVPYWQVHTMNLVAALPSGPLRAGTTVNFEPIASVDGQGFFLEDMWLITKDGAELLTPGVPYTANEIEAAMK